MRALCDQEDDVAFRPFSSEKASDQEIPSLIIQLNSIVQETTAQAFKEGTLHQGRLKPQADAARIGRYVYAFADERCGLWFGLHFDLWMKYGRSPLWGVFDATNFGRAIDVQPLLAQWAEDNGILAMREPNGQFVVAFDLPVREEKDKVIRSIVDRFKEIGTALSGLKPREKNEIPDA